jgi:hypothetical protein
MAPHSEFIVVGHGPKQGSGVSIDYSDNGITVTGWTGSVLRVFSAGRELGDTRARPPVPDFD